MGRKLSERPKKVRHEFGRRVLRFLRLLHTTNLPKLTTINIGVFRNTSYNFCGSLFMIKGIIDGDIANE